MKHENSQTYTNDGVPVQGAPDQLDPFRDAASSASHYLTADLQELWICLQTPCLLMTAAGVSEALQGLRPFAERFLTETEVFKEAQEAASNMEVGESRRQLERLLQLKMRLLLIEYEIVFAHWADRGCQSGDDGGSAPRISD